MELIYTHFRPILNNYHYFERLMKRALNIWVTIFVFSSFLLTPLFAKYNPESEKGRGFDLSGMDKSVDPSQNFYKYAVGNWLKNNPLPAEYSRWGVMEELTERNNKIIRQLLEDAASRDAAEGTIVQKLGDFYKTGMDSMKIEKDGIQPIRPIIEKVNNIKSKKELYDVSAFFFMRVGNPYFNFFAEADAKNSKMVIGWLYQGGLGLPDRDYYLKDDDRSKEVRERYKQYISNMFKHSGLSETDAGKNSETIMKLETELAQASMTRVELRDPVKTFNKMSLQQLTELAPGFDWRSYFGLVGVNDPGELNVAQPEFFKKVGQMMSDVSLEDWKTYLKWNLLRSSADYLSSTFVNEKFEFEGKFLNGVKEMQPRWKRVLNTTNGMLGEALGQLYVKDHFTPAAKQRAEKIVKNLLTAMRERILAVDWMSEATKQQALIKLEGFGVKIGYPEKWMDYTSYKVTENSYYENVMQGSLFLTEDNISRIGKPVDETKWEITPQIVNAYYHPIYNEIVFPAGILQPPFYDPEADDAINYGGMGVVIGHEITHGFDDQGRQYDAEGNIRDWWTAEDNQKFNERAKVVVEQFNSYVPVDSVSINGEMTQGENIADLGGLNVAFTAFKKTEQFKSNEKIDGFTPVQRFFLSWAQVWRNNINRENLLLRLKIDPHSPGEYRVIGPIANMPEFIEAFNIKEGSPMARPENQRARIW